MRIRFQSIALFVLAFALVIPAHAQQPPVDISVRLDAAEVSAFPQVALTVTVRDANGVPVPGLDAHAFEVNEDRAPQARPITGVEPVTNPDLPVCVVLVVDVSGSMAGQSLTDAQAAARALVARAAAAYDVVDITQLPGRLQQLVQLETALSLADDGLAWVDAIPTLLGTGTPRTYLVLVLNESELRPGGGFITGVGEVHVATGEVVSMTFADSYAADDFTQPYPLAPEPLRHFMNIDLLVFRDSNWSPDFPTAVRQALALYRPGYPVTVDGVVAIDLHATQVLVDAIGPLLLPGETAPLTGAQLLDYIYKVWAPEDGEFGGAWWAARKSFMEPLAAAVLARIKSNAIDWMALARAGRQLLEQKHVLLYFDDPTARAFLAERGWDGGLHTSSGDYLMVVEANVGFNKASVKLLRRYAYDVDLTQSPPRATVTLSYTHTSQIEIACKSEARYDPEYKQMMDRCYWGYLRLYVPEGAQLLHASRHPIPADSVANGKPWDGQARVSIAPEGGYTVFEQAVLLPTASQVTVQFTYTLPAGVVAPASPGMPEDALVYRLLWQKQAGLMAFPARVMLHLPRNAVLCSSQPRSTLDANGVLLYDVTLGVDRSFRVCYRLLEEAGQ